MSPQLPKKTSMKTTSQLLEPNTTGFLCLLSSWLDLCFHICFFLSSSWPRVRNHRLFGRTENCSAKEGVHGCGYSITHSYSAQRGIAPPHFKGSSTRTTPKGLRKKKKKKRKCFKFPFFLLSFFSSFPNVVLRVIVDHWKRTCGAPAQKQMITPAP